MPSASFGCGLPPDAPMSPPAQLTRISTRPELGLDLLLHLRHRRLVADVAGHRRGLAAMPGDRLGDRAEIGGLAEFGRRGPGYVVDGDVRAELRQPFRHRPPEPAARAGDERDLAGELFRHPSVSFLGAKADRAHVAGAAADHGEFVVGDRGVLAALPGRASVGVVGEAVDAGRSEAGGERGRRLRRIKAPPFRPQEVARAAPRALPARAPPSASRRAPPGCRASRRSARRRRRSRSAPGDSLHR